VVVDYAGPGYLRTICRRFDIQTFDRIKKVRVANFVIQDLQALDQLSHLELFCSADTNREKWIEYFETNPKFLCLKKSLPQLQHPGKYCLWVRQGSESAETLSSEPLATKTAAMNKAAYF
jgi:hypothetical protein